VLRDATNPETWLQLGNAYRKAKPGEGGGKAFESYKKALEVKPDYAVADIRLAKLFESQKNWEFVLQYLNDAITRDPKFAPAYYELFYYYFFREKYPEAEEQLKKYVTVTDDVVQNDYLYAQLCFGHKDYDCAITKALTVATAMGAETKPKVFKLLAYSYFEKGDSINAKKYMDAYFGKERPEGLIAKDYELQAKILLKTGGSNEEVKNVFLKGAALDTVLTSKIDGLKAAAEIFKARGDSLSRITEGDIRVEIIKLKPTPSQRDYFDAGLAYYQGKDYKKSDSIFTFYTQKWPDEVFGWQMEFSIQRAIDTSMALGLAVPSGLKYLEVLEKDKDTAKNKKTIIGVAGYLAQYYANIAKDREKAIVYLEKLVALDPTNADFKKYLDDMKKPPKPQKSGPRPPVPNARPKAPDTGKNIALNK
jgi:tetratricopeptide (TPR) repeat protein